MTPDRNQTETAAPIAGAPVDSTIEDIFKTDVQAIDTCLSAHSTRLDVLRSTITAFTIGIESKACHGGQLDGYHILNLMEALQTLVPSEEDLDAVVRAAWRDAYRAHEAANSAKDAPAPARKHAGRTRRNVTARSAA